MLPVPADVGAVLNHNVSQSSRTPPVLALFQKRLEGDDALLELGRRCFKAAGLGMEFYAETFAELNHLLTFRTGAKIPAVAHLARHLNMMTPEGRDMVLGFARRFRDKLVGLVVHDQPEVCSSFHDYVAALRALAAGLQQIPEPPLIHVEYASGLPLDAFIAVFEAISDLQEVSCAIDIGHVGLWQVRKAFSARHRGVDVCGLQADDPALPALVEDVQQAVASATGAVLNVVESLGRLEKPIHFHLHDGHPIAAVNPLGISDHLGFSERIPVPFTYRGRPLLDPMFGATGLEAIIEAALRHPGPQRVSFTLEIHPTGRMLALGPYEDLFSHWKDKTSARKMFHWLCMLVENQRLILKLLHESERNPL